MDQIMSGEILTRHRSTLGPPVIFVGFETKTRYSSSYHDAWKYTSYILHKWNRFHIRSAHIYIHITYAVYIYITNVYRLSYLLLGHQNP